jgi:hypothetical protein
MTVLDVEVEINETCDFRNVFPTPESFIRVWQMAESLDDVVETLEGAHCTADRATIYSRASRYRESHHIPLQYFPQGPGVTSTDWEAMRELAVVLGENSD